MEFRQQIFFMVTITHSVLTSTFASQSKQKQPMIIMHKQQMAHDGAFNFAFAGENGIKRGETIHPDGTRQGAYSYVDPNGETISVKYSAGKEGFKILEGDHIPKAPVAALHEAATSNRYSPLAMPNFASSDENEDYGLGPTGSYSHNKARVNPHYKSVYKVYEDASAEHYHQAVPYSRQAQYESGYEDRTPHSFGNGYSFEFGSGQS